MKKILLAILGIAFALVFTSCEDQEQTDQKQFKSAEQKPMYPHRPW
jgi:hypothetical protein